MRERSKESKETDKRIPDGDGDICLSLRPRTRVRERAQARERSRKAQKAQSEAKREAFVQRWRDTIFADGVEDPVPVIVAEAIRKFALTLIEVMTAVPGPENLQAKKVCAANKINIRTYFRYLKICRKTIP